MEAQNVTPSQAPLILLLADERSREAVERLNLGKTSNRQFTRFPAHVRSPAERRYHRNE